MEITGLEVRGKGRMTIKHLVVKLLQEIQYVDRPAACGCRPGTVNDEFRSALSSVDSKTLSQTALYSRRVLE